MLFFKKKKDQEEFEEKGKSKEVKKSVPKEKKERKQPTKPWGKKERVLVLVVLIFSVGTSAILALFARSWKLPGLPKISLPTFKTKTIVIEKDKDSLTDRLSADEAVNLFRDKTRALSGVYGLYVIRLSNGFSYGYNEDDSFEPASLNKLPVMLSMYKTAEEGNINLQTIYKLKNSDKISGSGNLYSKPAGYELTYKDLVRLMGNQSDNTAFNIAKNILSQRIIVETIQQLGMTNTEIFSEEQKTTPHDIGIFFQELMNAEVVSPASRDEILEFLTKTTYESWVAEGIPEHIRVAHKFGRELHVVNDAGVVFASGPEGDEPFVLVILSKGVVESEADAVLPELAKLIYEIEVR